MMRRHSKSVQFLLVNIYLFYIGTLIPWKVEGISLQHRRVAYAKNRWKGLQTQSYLNHPIICGWSKCNTTSTTTTTTTESTPTTILPDFMNEDLGSITTELIITTLTPPLESSEILTESNYTGTVNFDELTKILQFKRKECKKWLASPEPRKRNGLSTFTCEKLKLSTWLLDQLDKNSTELINSYVFLVKNINVSEITQENELLPESSSERLIFRFINAFGEPIDKLLFYQFKKYTKSRELKVNIPNLMELQVSPRIHSEEFTGRTLFDPGFNLKLKFPFFHDELKVAVSTGPSFIAGLGVGLIVLGIKSIFAPFVLAMKAVILSWFFKDMSPVDFVKTLAAPMLPTWLTGMRPSPEPPFTGWSQTVEHYEPPPVHNTWDSFGPPPRPKKNKGLMGIMSNLLPFTSYDSSHQYSQVNPMFRNQRPPPDSGYDPTGSDYTYVDGEGRTQIMRPPHIENPSGGDGVEEPGDPSGLKMEVENFDPFYSPLLSRIDSIFMHLGFTDEGCKERAVCSVYKYPVKYAPYSNLLSAQLSKHQNELKRPVNTSPKILRYFKYMKAAKDGQAALNCIELYPKCTNDTEKLTNLPMVKTFQQLTELMGTTGASG